MTQKINEENNTGQEITSGQGNTSGQGKKRRLTTHGYLLITLAVLLLACILVILYRFNNWGQLITQEEIFQDGLGEYSDTFDMILPVVDADGNIIVHEKGTKQNILLFGNAPFADDRHAKDGLANLIADMTGANIYNCSISGSYLASEQPYYNPDNPMDAYVLYWLVCQAVFGETNYVFESAELNLQENTPPDAKEAIETLNSIDLNDIDVIAILYDGYDYLLGHCMFNDDKPTDITQFTGNLEASIELLQQYYPKIRIIVLSPPYAFSDKLDEDGNYISSDIATYGWDVLSTYSIKQYGSCANRQVTYIDNLYGTITEENAKDYLIDNLHLNVAGRKKIAERFVYALEYYDHD